MTPEPLVPPPAERWLPSNRLLLLLLVSLVLLTRLPFLMHSLDEVDSANFALGTMEFRIPLHQPHPPGQFYYIMLMQGLNWLVRDELTTLSLASALFSSLTLVPYYLLLRLVFGGNERLALGATALTAFTYGFWLVGLRPISDPVGCFFVYATVCALLYGIDRRGWFAAGMALFAFTLGVKQLSLYFLAPLVILINLIVLLKRGPKPCLLGAILFAAVLAGWLLPSIHNCGGWTKYVALSRFQQEQSYTAESLLTHYSSARVKEQAWHDIVQIWGNPAFAAVMLAAAVLGLRPLWRVGPPAKLFCIFGLGTILYIFCVPTMFSKYYMYTVPLYGAAAAAGLAWLSSRGFAARLGPPARVLPGALGVAILLSVVITSPLLGRVKMFRSPAQAAYEFLQRRQPQTLAGINVIDNHVLATVSLHYFQQKTWFGTADTGNNFANTLAVLGSGKPLYILSSVPNEGFEPHLRPLEHFVWDPPLHNILQGWQDTRNLYLYEVKGLLPDEYQLRSDVMLPILLNRGMWVDGWLGPDADIILPRDSAPTDFLELAGEVPPDFGFQYPLKVAYGKPGGRAGAEFTVERPGAFDVFLPLEKTVGSNYTDLHLVAAQSCVPAEKTAGSPDSRRLSMLLTHLRCTSPEHPVLVRYGSGWYNLESDQQNSWRWSNVDGAMDIVAARAGTLALEGAFISNTGANAVEVLVDGKVTATVNSPHQEWSPAQTLRMPLEPGRHQLVFHSRQPAAQASPTDARALAFGVRNLQVRLE